MFEKTDVDFFRLQINQLDHPDDYSHKPIQYDFISFYINQLTLKLGLTHRQEYN